MNLLLQNLTRWNPKSVANYIYQYQLPKLILNKLIRLDFKISHSAMQHFLQSNLFSSGSTSTTRKWLEKQIKQLKAVSYKGNTTCYKQENTGNLQKHIATAEKTDSGYCLPVYQ